MSVSITTTNEAAALHGIKMLVYGDAGVGKTTLCATAPAPLILSAESGLLSLKDYAIPVIQILTMSDLTEAYEYLATGADQFQYQTICLDSISEIAEVCLANAKRINKDGRKAYGQLAEEMDAKIKQFRDLPGRNVYFTAKIEYYQDESGVSKYYPSMPGNRLTVNLPYYFDEVMCLRMGADEHGTAYRYLQTSPDVQYHCKDRSGKLDLMEQPNLLHIVNKIMGV